MRRFFVLPAILVILTGLVPVRVAIAQQPVTTVQILNSDGSERSSFSVATANQFGGMSVAVADLGNDGVPEILLGNGLGNEPRIHAYREDGSEIGSFLAYDASMGVGVNVAACDLDGDGMNEIVTVPARGGSPHVRVFNNFGTLIDPGFLAYDESMREGVNLACGDLDDDGRAELVTLPAAGAGPHARVWKRDGSEMKRSEEFFAFGADDRRGLVGVVHDGMLTVASQRGSSSDELTYVIHSDPTLANEKTITTNARGITAVFTRDNDISFATSQDATIVDATSVTTTIDAVTNSVVAAAVDFDKDGTDETVVVESKPLFGEQTEGKTIVVDLSEQRLYAYENGLLDNSFLVSTARSPWQTPVGEHAVLAKIPLVHYAGGTGADAYDLGWVPYNLRFYPHIYIHYAPWHNNFGHPMSHGCVNVNLENMKWIYDWADVGVPVIVQE